MVKKITAIVGSPRMNDSTSIKLMNKLDEVLSYSEKDYEFQIIQLSEYTIKESDGSGKEFFNGTTLFDDDMKYIEDKLIESDIVLFVSPVYAHNVSSYMKKFIDRISYWLHIYRLIGKFGIVVSVSSNNGNELVNTYLESMMEYLGLNVLSKISIETVKTTKNPRLLDSYANSIFNLIEFIDYKNLKISYNQSMNFQHMKSKYLECPSCFERDYWERNKYFEYDEFEDLFITRI